MRAADCPDADHYSTAATRAIRKVAVPSISDTNPDKPDNDCSAAPAPRHNLASSHSGRSLAMTVKGRCPPAAWRFGSHRGNQRSARSWVLFVAFGHWRRCIDLWHVLPITRCLWATDRPAVTAAAPEVSMQGHLRGAEGTTPKIAVRQVRPAPIPSPPPAHGGPESASTSRSRRAAAARHRTIPGLRRPDDGPVDKRSSRERGARPGQRQMEVERLVVDRRPITGLALVATLRDLRESGGR